MPPWRRWREPLAVVLLIVVALPLVVSAVQLVAGAVSGRSRGLGSIPLADNLVLLAAAAAVLWCATPLPALEADGTAEMSPHAWAIAVAGLVIIGLAVLGSLFWSVLRLLSTSSWPPFPDVGYLALITETVMPLVVPVGSLVAVIMAVRRVSAARSAGGGRARRSPPPDLAEGEPAASESGDGATAPAEPERLPAAWRADEAAGAVWLTADDAAQGRPGLSWSDPSRSDPSGADPSGADSSPTPGWGAAPTDRDGPRAQAAPEARRPPSVELPSAAQDDDLH